MLVQMTISTLLLVRPAVTLHYFYASLQVVDASEGYICGRSATLRYQMAKHTAGHRVVGGRNISTIHTRLSPSHKLQTLENTCTLNQLMTTQWFLLHAILCCIRTALRGDISMIIMYILKPNFIKSFHNKRVTKLTSETMRMKCNS